MSAINDGGPAFPADGLVEKATGAFVHSASQGMSLRDWFAGQALAGLMANPSIISCGQLKSESHLKNISVVALKAADNQLAARSAASTAREEKP